MNNRYVRKTLAATRNGVVDPSVEVHLWLDELQDVVRDYGEDLRSQQLPTEPAYDLLALLGKLRRARRDLIDDGDGRSEFEEAILLFEGNSQLLCQAALSVPNGEAWLHAATEYAASFDQVLDVGEETRWAVDLLEDLDDAELVIAVAARQGITDPEVENDVGRCTEWLGGHIDLFLPASVYAQAVGQTLRPDLEQWDYELAATVLKFVDLLDEAEQAEYEMQHPIVKPLPPSFVSCLYEQYRVECEGAPLTAFRASEVLPEEAEPVLAADADVELPQRCLRWRSPDGRYLAEMYVPPKPTDRGDEEPLVLVVYRQTDDAPAEELAGQRVWLGSATPKTLQKEGRVTFLLAELRVSDRLCLSVGSRDRLWEALEE